MSDAEQEVMRLLHTGDQHTANMLFDKVLSSAEPAMSAPLHANMQMCRAIVAWRLERVSLSLELTSRAWIELGDGPHVTAVDAHTLSSLAYIMEGIGNRRAALDILRSAVEIARVNSSDQVLAACLQRLGGTLNFHALDSDFASATEIFAEAKKVLGEGMLVECDGKYQRAIRGAYARALAGVGELNAARLEGQRTLDAGLAADEPWSISVGNWVLATVHAIEGNYLKAQELCTISVQQSRKSNDFSLLARFSLDLADFCAHTGDVTAEAQALRDTLRANRAMTATLKEGLSQALEQRRLAVTATLVAEMAQKAAAHDALTGLVNRRGLENSGPTLMEMTKSTIGKSWVLLIDVDWFKEINDLAGHPVGDSALLEIAQLLRRETRAEDLVARWAGDEFVVILGPLATEENAGLLVAERIRHAVDTHHWAVLPAEVRHPTVSIGVSGGTGAMSDLFIEADRALYDAKRNGRNQVREATPHPSLK
jgi:diguanylate cyclase (GGDEF)-like protein